MNANEVSCSAAVPAQAAYTYKGTTAYGGKRKSKMQAHFFDKWFPALQPNATVLEIGTGRGEFARECLGRGYKYVGIEPSGSLAAERRSEGFEIHETIVPPVPTADAQFDLVHSFDVVEHLLDYQNVLRFVADSRRVLKPGGHISIVAPNCQTIGRLFYAYDYQHSFVTTLHRLEGVLFDAGFELVKSRCYLMSLTPSLKWLDRSLAHTLVPIGANGIVTGLLASFVSEEFVRGIHKNLYDHVAVIGRRPLR